MVWSLEVSFEAEVPDVCSLPRLGNAAFEKARRHSSRIDLRMTSWGYVYGFQVSIAGDKLTLSREEGEEEEEDWVARHRERSEVW